MYNIRFHVTGLGDVYMHQPDDRVRETVEALVTLGLTIHGVEPLDAPTPD